MPFRGHYIFLGVGEAEKNAPAGKTLRQLNLQPDTGLDYDFPESQEAKPPEPVYAALQYQRAPDVSSNMALR